MAVNEISAEERDKIKKKSAWGLPDRPSDRGMSAAEIKKAFYGPLVDVANSLVSEINRIARECNEEITAQNDRFDTASEEYEKSALEISENAERIENVLGEMEKISKALGSLVETVSGKAESSRRVNGHTLDKDVTLNKRDIGLENIDNTADLDKPISEATQSELDKINLELRREKKLSELVNDKRFVSPDTRALENYVQKEYVASDIKLTLDDSFVLTVGLLNGEGKVVAQKKVDFPVEESIVKIGYEEGYMTFTLRNGNSTTVDLRDIIRGVVVTDKRTIAGYSLGEDITAEQLSVALDLGGLDERITLNAEEIERILASLDKKVDKTTRVNGHTLDKDVTLNKRDIGLGNVDNTADLDKPISILQQEAIDEINEELRRKKKTSELENDKEFVTPDTAALENYVTSESVVTGMAMTLDENYVLTLGLVNKTGEVVAEKKVDFPVEMSVVDLEYEGGIISFTLRNGNKTEVDVRDIIKGLVTDKRAVAGYALSEDITVEQLTLALNIGDITKRIELNASEIERRVPNMSVLDEREQNNRYFDFANKYTRLYAYRSKGRGDYGRFCVTEQPTPPLDPDGTAYEHGKGDYFVKYPDNSFNFADYTTETFVTSNKVTLWRSADYLSVEDDSELGDKCLVFNKYDGNEARLTINYSGELKKKTVFETEMYIDLDNFEQNTSDNWFIRFNLLNANGNTIQLVQGATPIRFAPNSDCSAVNVLRAQISIPVKEWCSFKFEQIGTNVKVSYNGLEVASYITNAVDSLVGVRIDARSSTYVKGAIVKFANTCFVTTDESTFSFATLASVLQRTNKGYVIVPSFKVGEEPTSMAEVSSTLAIDYLDNLAAPLGYVKDVKDITEQKNSEVKRALDEFTEKFANVGAFNKVPLMRSNGGGLGYALVLDGPTGSEGHIVQRSREGYMRCVVPAVPDSDDYCANIQYVDERFSGCSKAISFANYETMITALNGFEKDVYIRGQDIYVVTIGVPDVWISEIADTSVTYNYTTDEEFAAELRSKGSVQVGYYILSQLETQKVILTDYPTIAALTGGSIIVASAKSAGTAATAGKLANKIILSVDLSADAKEVPCEFDGSEGTIIPTLGILPIERGGTGAENESDAREKLGLDVIWSVMATYQKKYGAVHDRFLLLEERVTTLEESPLPAPAALAWNDNGYAELPTTKAFYHVEVHGYGNYQHEILGSATVYCHYPQTKVFRFNLNHTGLSFSGECTVSGRYICITKDGSSERNTDCTVYVSKIG